MPALRTVLVGCGGMAGHWLEILRRLPEVEIVCLVDTNLEAARLRRQEHELGDCTCLPGVGEALQAFRPDVVLDLTPPEARLEVARESIRHDCHLLAEKPMASSMAEALEMLRLARDSPRIHMIMQNRRYDPNIRRLGNFLASGELGTVTTLHGDFFTGPRFDGFRKEMDHVLLLDMAIHHFDAARFLLGTNAESVVSHEWNPSGSWFRHGASAIAIFTMENGVVYSYRGSWSADGFNTTWECAWRALCTGGSCLWDGAGGIRAEKVVKAGLFGAECADHPVPPVSTAGKEGGHEGCIREFLSSIRSGTEPETSMEDNVNSLAMVFGAIESARTGSRIRISELLKESTG